MINEKDKEYFLSLQAKDITIDLLTELFGDSYDRKTGQEKKSKFKTTEKVKLKAGECMNKSDIETTVGRIIYNKAVIQPAFNDKFGFINSEISSKGLDALEEMLSQALLDDKITVEEMYVYLDKTQWLGANLTHVLAPSFTMNTLKPIKEITDERDKLIAKNKDRIEKGDVLVTVDIENQLTAKAKEKLKNDPGMDLFNSGARGKFENNYKKTSIMMGTTYNPVEGKFELVANNYMEGIDKEHMHLQGNAIIAGAFPKAIGTADSGYLFKQLVATFQTVVLDKRGSDCGSKGTLEIKITKANADRLVYRYIKEGNKLIVLTPEVMKSYMGKTVQMRSPMYCTSEKLCNCCAGDIFYKMNIENVGLITAQISSDILNASMKKFHDSNQKMTEIDIESMFI